MCLEIQCRIPAPHDNREGVITATPDERAPLLAPEDARYGTDAPSADDGADLAPERTTSKTWCYAWRGFWIVFAILVIAVFVKGWIDADDVNVSAPKPEANQQTTHTNSLISKAP
jgi:hypothetical protein